MPPRNGVIQKPRNAKGTLRRLGRYLWQSAPLLILALGLSVAGNLFQLIGPTLCGKAIDAVAGGKGKVDFATVFSYARLMVLFYALLDRPLASFLWAALFMCWWGVPSLRPLAGIRSVLSGGALTVYTQFYAVLALPLIYLPLRTGIRVPKYVSYLFYPAHLALIYLLTM